MTRRTWAVARRYFFPIFAPGFALFVLGRRRVGGLLLALSGVIACFFRDPERSPQGGRETLAAYAAADGLITDVEEVEDESLGQAVRVSTFLNLHNVHVNRSPVGARVLEMRSIEGGYAPALFGGSGENYRIRTLLEGDFGRVVLVQKAGMIARRITPFVAPGDRAEAGARIGVIHFGSRTDVIFPLDSVETLVSPGDRVKAGLTKIARYRKTAEGESY